MFGQPRDSAYMMYWPDLVLYPLFTVPFKPWLSVKCSMWTPRTPLGNSCRISLRRARGGPVAEPLALLGLIRQLFPRGVRCVHIEHFTDNQGLKGTVKKWYSTKSGQYIMYALSRG